MLYKDNKKDADLQTFKFLNTMSYCNLAGIGEDWQTNMTKSRQNFNISKSKILFSVHTLFVSLGLFVTLMPGIHTQTVHIRRLHKENHREKMVIRTLTFIPHYLLLKSDVHVNIARCLLGNPKGFEEPITSKRPCKVANAPKSHSPDLKLRCHELNSHWQ